MKARMIQSVFVVIVFGISIIFPGLAGAATEGRPCIPEPTDELIQYGDIITCNISPVGDSDFYRFVGNIGEMITINAVEGNGSFGSPDVCIELFRPDTTLVASNCGEVATRIETLLDAAGEYTIRVTESGNDQAMSYNLVLERLLPVSPTAKTINLGEILVGEMISPSGDIDFYIFQGTVGDIISLTAVEGNGSFGSPDVCIELFRPDGTKVGSTLCGEVSVVFAPPPLEQTGAYIIRITEAGDDQAMTFNLEFQCIFGQCEQLTRPVCDIQMSQSVYIAGDIVSATVFRLANPGPDPVAVEWAVWLGIPSIPPISIINVGADGTVVLPAGFDLDLGPINLFTAGAAPLGQYEFSCRLLDPVTKRQLALDVNPFTIVE